MDAEVPRIQRGAAKPKQRLAKGFYKKKYPAEI